MLKLKNCCLNELHDKLHEKKVYVYGAGMYIDNFRDRNSQIQIEKYIYKFADKKKLRKKVGDRVFEVISPDTLATCICNSDLILIASSHYYVDIIAELDLYPQMDGINCYILPFVENNFDRCIVDWNLYSIFRKEQMVIPKIIHYCWFGNTEIPEQQQRYMESWKKYCPDYKIIEWSEKNYDIKKNPYVFEAYQNRKWAFVSDFVRLDVVHQYGGIYLDTDVELVKSLDELLHFDGFMGFETWSQVASGLGFGSIKGHHVLKKMINLYNKIHFVEENREGPPVPCPVLQTEILVELGLIKNNQIQIIDNGFLILPTSFLGGMNWGTRRIKIEDNTYSIHHYAGSWIDNENDILSKREYAAEILMARIEENVDSSEKNELV